MINEMTRRDALKWVAAVTAVTVPVGFASAQEEKGKPAGPPAKDLSKVLLPDDRKAAVQALKAWLTARGFDCKENPGGTSLQFRRGVLLNIYPDVASEDLDRLVTVAFYAPKDESKGSEELEKLATRVNKRQDLLQAYVTTDGYFAGRGYLTFYDEFSAREFDKFVDLMARVIRQHVFSDPEVGELLK